MKKKSTRISHCTCTFARIIALTYYSQYPIQLRGGWNGDGNQLSHRINNSSCYTWQTNVAMNLPNDRKINCQLKLPILPMKRNNTLRSWLMNSQFPRVVFHIVCLHYISDSGTVDPLYPRSKSQRHLHWAPDNPEYPRCTPQYQCSDFVHTESSLHIECAWCLCNLRKCLCRCFHCWN